MAAGKCMERPSSLVPVRSQNTTEVAPLSQSHSFAEARSADLKIDFALRRCTRLYFRPTIRA